MSAAEDFDDAVTCEGDAEAKNILRDWLTKRVKTSIELDGEVTLELHNVGAGADGAIHSTEWEFTEPVEDVVEELVEAAIEDAMNVGRGSVRFKVVVEGRKKIGRAAFTLRIPKNDDFAPDELEEIEELATRKGVLTQLMRHQEKTMKVGLGGSDRVMSYMQRMLDQAHARIKELEGQTLNNAKVYEELLSGKHARDLELRKLENEEKNKEKVVGILMQGMPILLTKLLAGKAADSMPGAPPGGPPPGAASAASASDEPMTQLEYMVLGFFSTLNPQQLQDIMAKNVFSGPQLMALMEIGQFVQARYEAREAKKAAPQPS